MNQLSRLYSHASFLYDYFPCSLDCSASKLLASSNRSILLKHGCNEIVLNWDSLQSGQFLVFPGYIMKYTENGWQSRFGSTLKQDSSDAIWLEFHLP